MGKRAKVTKTKIKKTHARLPKKKNTLAVVYASKSKSEVDAKKHTKGLKDPDTDEFPLVRRNRKIQVVKRVNKAETDKLIAVKVVFSKRASLSEAKCVYAPQVIEALQQPKKFVFKDLVVTHLGDKTTLQSIHKSKSSPEIMDVDVELNDLVKLRPELEFDMGVIKESVKQLENHDVIAINTHPGHHARPTRPCNFCIINNNAVAAALIKQRHPHVKVGVLDLDAHPGDGTQAFFELHKGLFQYRSIHTSVSYTLMDPVHRPNGHALNPPKIPPKRWIHSVDAALKELNVDIVIVALGYDTMKGDLKTKCTGFQNRPEHYYEVGKIFGNRPERFLILQEGGYDLRDTSQCFSLVMKGFRESRKSQMSAELKP